jgi:hypothetical protein
MLKRIVVLGVVGAFLAAPPAIARSSSTVKAPAADKAGSHRGPCPFENISADV